MTKLNEVARRTTMVVLAGGKGRSSWNSVAIGDAAVIRAWRAEERAGLFGHRGTADAIYRNPP